MAMPGLLEHVSGGGPAMNGLDVIIRDWGILIVGYTLLTLAVLYG